MRYMLLMYGAEDRWTDVVKLHLRPLEDVAVNLYVNGKRKLHKEGHRITRVRIKRLPRGKFTIKIVALVNTGERVISVRSYDDCRKKGDSHTHVEQPKYAAAR